MVQNDKKICLSRSIYQESYIIWLSFVVRMCKMIISPGFFSLFQNFDFLCCYGLKGQKTVQNDKKFCPSCFISQELYIIWLSFMVGMCKMMISHVFFFIFLKFWFFRFLGGKSAKNCPKWQKSLYVMLHISVTIHHMIVIYGIQCVKW